MGMESNGSEDSSTSRMYKGRSRLSCIEHRGDNVT